MERDKEKTDVIFRTFKTTFICNDTIALFPGVAGNQSLETCSSYQHIGQHGAASLSIIRDSTRAARPSEFKALKRELEGFGYNLRVVTRMTRKHITERQAQLRGTRR